MREWILCSPTQSYLRPLPKRLGVTPRGRSGRLERVLTDFGCEHSFARGTRSVQEHYGFELGAAAPTCRALQPDAWRRTQQKRLRNHADQIAHLRVFRANRQWESLWN